MHWLNRILAEELGYKVDLKAETMPFVSPLIFNRKETLLSDEMKSALSEIRKVYQRSPASTFVIESYPKTGSQKEKMLAEKRADIIAVLFVEDFKIPQGNINKIIHRKTMKSPTVKISIL